MWFTTLMVIIAITIVLILEFGWKYLLVSIARIDSLFSPLRIKPPSGQFYFIVKGSPDGPLDQIVHSIPGYKIEKMGDETQEFVKLGAGEIEHLGALNQLLSPLGLVWVGFYRRYYKRTRRYEALEKKKSGSGWDVVSKERTDELFFWRTEMVAVIDGAETRDNFPVNVVIPFTTQILNPVRAEFLSGKWEVQATNGVRSAGRDHVETKLYNDLLRERDSGPDVLLDSIVKANTAYSLIDTFGVEVIAPRVESFDLSSANSDYAAATRLLGVKKLEADAAEEDARKITTLANAEAAAIAARAKAYRDGDVGDLVIADAIRDSKNISVLSINGGMPIAVTPPDRK